MPWLLVAVLLCIVSYTARIAVAASDCPLQDYWTALHCASMKGHVECVRLLLDRGAGVDVDDVSSWLVVRTHGLAWVLRGVRRALVDVCV